MNHRRVHSAESWRGAMKDLLVNTFICAAHPLRNRTLVDLYQHQSALVLWSQTGRMVTATISTTTRDSTGSHTNAHVHTHAHTHNCWLPSPQLDSWWLNIPSVDHPTHHSGVYTSQENTLSKTFPLTSARAGPGTIPNAAMVCYRYRMWMYM